MEAPGFGYLGGKWKSRILKAKDATVLVPEVSAGMRGYGLSVGMGLQLLLALAALAAM